jgi:hypothetical protein
MHKNTSKGRLSTEPDHRGPACQFHPGPGENICEDTRSKYSSATISSFGVNELSPNDEPSEIQVGIEAKWDQGGYPSMAGCRSTCALLPLSITVVWAQHLGQPCDQCRGDKVPCTLHFRTCHPCAVRHGACSLMRSYYEWRLSERYGLSGREFDRLWLEAGRSKVPDASTVPATGQSLSEDVDVGAASPLLSKSLSQLRRLTVSQAGAPSNPKVHWSYPTTPSFPSDPFHQPPTLPSQTSISHMPPPASVIATEPPSTSISPSDTPSEEQAPWGTWKERALEAEKSLAHEQREGSAPSPALV